MSIFVTIAIFHIPRLAQADDVSIAPPSQVQICETKMNAIKQRRKFRHELYATMEEAMAAASLLGIRKQDDYEIRYRLDDKLSSIPEEVYKSEWRGFPYFLSQARPEPYATLQEAKLAVLRLNIKSVREYKKRYLEDPFLPCKPNMVYKDEWEDWFDFLGKQKKAGSGRSRRY